MAEEDRILMDLVETLRAEQRRQWLRGERLFVEAIFERHPELLAIPACALELLYSEMVLREEAGDITTLDEYVRRFPCFASQLPPLFEVHRALESNLLLDSTSLSGAAAGAGLAAPWPVVPGYEILEVLGRGGMGIVYKAWHIQLKRLVALKMILPESDITPELLARFQNEAEAVARLRHPHIVQIYEIGLEGGRPYLSLEYVDGGGLNKQLDGTPQPPRMAAALLRTLALAIHHAHECGIVHRDLKPANILLQRSEVGGRRSEVGGRRSEVGGQKSEVGGQKSEVSAATDQPADLRPPISDLRPLTSDLRPPTSDLRPPTSALWPKITDFGLAKIFSAGGNARTQSGAVLGTPSYIAPEQAEGKGRAIGPATDVYALGAILYEMLTGRPPFKGQSPLDTLRLVLAETPVAVSRLQPKVPRDLETICAHCLEKEPGKRYASALSLAEDLERFENKRPIRARRTGSGERAWRWCRRNPALAAVSALAVAAVVAALVLGVRFAIHEVEAAASLRTALAESQRLAADLALDRGLERCERGDGGEGMLWLAHSLELTPPQAGALEHSIRWNLGAWRSHLHRLAMVWDHPQAVSTVAASPDGKILFTASADAGRLWDAATGQLIALLPAPAPLAAGVKRGRGFSAPALFSPDGRTLVTCHHDYSIRRWDAATGQPLGAPLAYPDPIAALRLRGDGALEVATVHKNKIVHLWVGATQAKGSGLGHAFGIHAVVFVPDGTHLLSGGGAGDRGEVRLWDLATGRVLRTFTHDGPVADLAVSADGTKLLTGTRYWKARLWDLATGTQLGPFLQHPAPVRGLAFTSDGRHFLTGCADGKARLWLTATMTPVGQPLEHQGPVTALLFSADGKRALTASADRTARLWDLAAPHPVRVPLAYSGYANAMAFSPEGAVVATGGDDKTARLWDTATGKPFGPGTLKFPDEVQAVAFSGDGTLVLCGCDDGTAHLCEAATWRPRRQPLPQQGRVRCVAIDHAGALLLTGSAAGGGGVLWDAGTGQRLATLPHRSTIGVLALSPNRQRLLSGAQDGTARLWNRDGGALGPVLQHRSFVRAAVFSPDNTKALTGSADSTARLWDVATGAPLGMPLRHKSEVRAVAFNSDGGLLATGAWDHYVRLWDGATGKPVGPPLFHEGSLLALAFRADGATLLSATTADNSVRHWPVPRPMEGERARLVLGTEVATGLVLDADGGVRVLDAASWRQRRQRLRE
jgi:eukaryotic-like serine/threonine-protein kinase